MYRKFGKRALDILLSGCGIVILSPLYLILSIAIKADDPGPIFFRQKRVGIHKTHFQILKFRTMKMCTPHDVPTHQLQNPEQYITRTGKLLRKTSLDELPQILQIFTGKMTIIGPRSTAGMNCLLTSKPGWTANMPGSSALLSTAAASSAPFWPY